MPGLFLHVGVQLQCFHAAAAPITPTQVRVSVGGKFVATTQNQLIPTSCPFQIPVPSGTKPQPCLKIQWVNVSSRVKIMGKPVLLQSLPGSGLGNGADQMAPGVPQVPPSIPTISNVQLRVSGM